MWTRFRVINREGVTGCLDRSQLRDGIFRCRRGKNKVADIGYGFAFFNPHIDLTGTGVVADCFCRCQKFRAEIFLTREVLDGIADIGVGKHRPRRNVSRGKGFLARVLTAGANPDHFTVCNVETFDQSAFAHLATVCLQLCHHLLDQGIGPSLEREDPLVHEVRKNNTVGDGGIVQVRTVCIRNRLHQ